MDAEKVARKVNRAGPVLVAMVAILFGGVAAAFFLIDDVGDRVTVLEHSPCQQDADSPACQQLKIETDRARSIQSACIITRKAGLGCPALSRPGGLDNGPRTPEGRPNDPVGGDASGSPGNGGSPPNGLPGGIIPAPADQPLDAVISQVEETYEAVCGMATGVAACPDLPPVPNLP